MSSNSYVVPSRSWDNIEQEALDLRARFGLADKPNFPIFELLEKVLDLGLNLVSFQVDDRQSMKNAEGYTDPNGKFIVFREDVYRDGLAGDGRARFTAAHELGHWVMHTNIPLARAPIDRKIESFRLSEPQANQFAASLLMPKGFFSTFDTPQTVVRRHGVSFEAAQLRINYLTKRGSLR